DPHRRAGPLLPLCRGGSDPFGVVSQVYRGADRWPRGGRGAAGGARVARSAALVCALLAGAGPREGGVGGAARAAARGAGGSTGGDAPADTGAGRGRAGGGAAAASPSLL